MALASLGGLSLRRPEEYREEYGPLPPLYPVGGMGDGSTAVLGLEDGRVYLLLHDCGEDNPLEQIALSFDALILTQAEAWNELQALID